MQPWQQQEIDQLEHLVRLAQQRGWWDYVVVRARELEQSGAMETPKLFQGLEQKIAQRLQELGFKPPRRVYRKDGDMWVRVS